MSKNSRGFIFASTGANYITLARRAARTLKAVMPGAQLDFFTDSPTGDDVFDEEHVLSDSFFRPKIEALRNSRFDRTVYLDADIIVLADVSELFDVLERFEMAAVPAIDRLDMHMRPSGGIPRAFPLINSGVMAVRETEQTQGFLQEWESRVRSRGDKVDQPVLRELLFERGIAFTELGWEYNVHYMNLIDRWQERFGAPRILHCSGLHRKDPGNPEQAYRLSDVMGPRRARRLTALLNMERAKADPGARSGAAVQHSRRVLKNTTLSDISAPDAKRMVSAEALYKSAILAAAASSERLQVVVIGANDGKTNDPIYEVMKDELSLRSDLLLFEPQTALAAILEENYGFHPSYEIQSAAIGAQSELTLFCIKSEYWPHLQPGYASGWPVHRASTGVTSTNRNAVTAFVQRHAEPDAPIDDMIETVTVPCYKLGRRLEELGRRSKVDVLQVDAEGYDDEVLYACDLEITKPSVIRFESEHLSEDRRRRLFDYLKPSYVLNLVGSDVIGVRRAERPFPPVSQ